MHEPTDEWMERSERLEEEGGISLGRGKKSFGGANSMSIGMERKKARCMCPDQKTDM